MNAPSSECVRANAPESHATIPGILAAMSPTPAPIDWHRAFAWCLKAAAVGVLLVIIGRVTGSPSLTSLGGWLLAPTLVVAGGACLLVVLMAPAFPISWLMEHAPKELAWLWIALSAAAMLAWWAIWLGFIWAQLRYGA